MPEKEHAKARVPCSVSLWPTHLSYVATSAASSADLPPSEWSVSQGFWIEAPFPKNLPSRQCNPPTLSYVGIKWHTLSKNLGPLLACLTYALYVSSGRGPTPTKSYLSHKYVIFWPSIFYNYIIKLDNIMMRKNNYDTWELSIW